MKKIAFILLFLSSYINIFSQDLSFDQTQYTISTNFDNSSNREYGYEIFPTASYSSTNHEIIYDVGYYLSIDTVFDENDRYLGTQIISGSPVAGRELSVPCDINSGYYYLFFVIDPANEIVETNEVNNILRTDMFFVRSNSCTSYNGTDFSTNFFLISEYPVYNDGLNQYVAEIPCGGTQITAEFFNPVNENDLGVITNGVDLSDYSFDTPFSITFYIDEITSTNASIEITNFQDGTRYLINLKRLPSSVRGFNVSSLTSAVIGNDTITLCAEPGDNRGGEITLDLYDYRTNTSSTKSVTTSQLGSFSSLLNDELTSQLHYLQTNFSLSWKDYDTLSFKAYLMEQVIDNCEYRGVNLEAEPFIIKLSDNDTSSILSVLSGGGICPGDTAVITKSASFETFNWAHLYNNSSETVEITIPGTYYMYESNPISVCPKVTNSVNIEVENDCDGFVSGLVTGPYDSDLGYAPRLNNIALVTSSGLETTTDENGYYEFYFAREDVFEYIEIAEDNYYKDIEYVNLDSLFMMDVNENLSTYATDQITATTMNDKFEISYQLFPNPVKDQLNILPKENGTIKIYNTLGSASNEYKIEYGTVNLHHLSAGLHIYEIHSNNTVSKGFLIKE